MANETFQQFAQAAQEILAQTTHAALGWVHAHPAPAALYGVAATFLVIGLTDIYKKHRAKEQRSKEFIASLPEIKPVKLPPLGDSRPR